MIFVFVLRLWIITRRMARAGSWRDAAAVPARAPRPAPPVAGPPSGGGWTSAASRVGRSRARSLPPILRPAAPAPPPRSRPRRRHPRGPWAGRPRLPRAPAARRLRASCSRPGTQVPNPRAKIQSNKTMKTIKQTTNNDKQQKFRSPEPPGEVHRPPPEGIVPPLRAGAGVKGGGDN